MAKNTRLYRVTTPTRIRLIEAITPARAIAHAASTDFTAVIPDQREVFALATQGIEIEVAGDHSVSDETRTAVAQTPIPE